MTHNLPVEIDRILFYAVNGACRNDFLNHLMVFASNAGSGEALCAFALALMFLRRKNTLAAGLLLLAGLTVSYNVVSPLKEFVARPRPYAVLTGIHPVLVEKSFSFPSYHATVAFMAATIMSFFFRPRYIFFIFAVTIAFSRVYLGVHYPSDALAGAGLGAMIGYVLVKTSSKAFPT